LKEVNVLTIKKDFPILEFDCTREAVIEPHKLFGCLDVTERCVITFFKDVIDRLKEVEMECSAFCAVAKFRDVSFGQILYGGDDLSCDEWDSRCWHERTDVRQKVFELAVESCLNL